jgi:anaerobic magnesium-protoporphyrin IX monomethyl ester cyclase
MMKILLADQPAKGTNIDSSYANLGLLYLASTLRQDYGNTIQVDYLGPHQTLPEHVQWVQNYKPDIYAAGFTSKSCKRALDTFRAVREALPTVPIITGGPHPTAMPQQTLDAFPFDALVLGEGERTFSEIIGAYLGNNKPDLSNIAGIAYLDKGQYVQNPFRPVIENLDTIPFPAWDLINFKDYPGMHLKRQPIESSLLISRGCPFYCCFCSQPIWKLQKPWLRHRSAENICEEIELLYKRGVREIYLSSDELNFNHDWALRLCEAIAKLGHKNLYFQCNMRADKVTDELSKALASINCWMVHLGIESANNRVLKGIGKSVTVEQIEKAAISLSKAGIYVFAFMMLYQAWEEHDQLCFETPDEVNESLKWAWKMFHKKAIRYMSWQYCTPMPGARLFRIAERYNLYRGIQDDVWMRFDEHEACMNLPGISAAKMKWQLKKGILMKDWFIVRSGGLSWKHLWRAWENFIAFFK